MIWKTITTIAFSSCLGLAVSAGAPRPRDEVYSCGGETTRGEVDQYFARLKAAIEAKSPKSRFNQFVGPQFSITDERGRNLTFNLQDFNAITPGRIRLEDWREISARGPEEVEGIGWRGCMMNHGKVWFQSNEKHGLELIGFNRSMAWEQASR